MSERGLGPYLHETWGGWLQVGDVSVDLDGDQFEALIGDEAAQIGLAEKQAGAPLALILEHYEQEGRLRCAALTKAGDRCKHYVPGFYRGNLDGWLKGRARGLLCFIHEERTMNVERVEPNDTPSIG